MTTILSSELLDMLQNDDAYVGLQDEKVGDMEPQRKCRKVEKMKTGSSSGAENKDEEEKEKEIIRAWRDDPGIQWLSQQSIKCEWLVTSLLILKIF